MSRKKKFFHQLEEKIAETFLAHVLREVLYIYLLQFSDFFTPVGPGRFDPGY